MSTSATIEISVLTQRLKDIYAGYTAGCQHHCHPPDKAPFFYFIRDKFRFSTSYEEVRDLDIPALAKHLHSKGILPGDRP